ncbi:MAG: hypothetical protein KJZ86_03350 [Caldilineaceae bacterium]|nr:hypothetical protein [Caldilineaceae bacterium]
MLDKLNPFRKSKNPLDQLGVDELRAARFKLEKSRERTLEQIRELEDRKGVFFEEGAQAPDSRIRLDRARRIKEAEEQVHHLDQQLVFFGKQIQIINRLAFLKQNRQQMIDLGIDKVLGKMDSGELRGYVDDISLSGAVNSERLEELTSLLEEALGAGITSGEDPEIARLLEEMERASMPAMPTISGESASGEGGEQEPPLSA